MLNLKQIQEVSNYLATLKKLSRSKHEELVDHLCCDIETRISQGLTFEKALAICKERCNENEVKKIHSSNQSNFIMTKLIIGVFLFAFASIGIFSESIDTDRPTTTQSKIIIDPPATYPLSDADFKISSAYGPSIHPLTNKERMHIGIDWRAPFGTPVQSAGDGIVLEAGKKGNYGNCIIIAHDEVYQTLYAHLKSIEVKAGDVVIPGQCIGYVGSSGVSTGPHLHYEVIKNGVNVNPAQYLP